MLNDARNDSDLLRLSLCDCDCDCESDWLLLCEALW